MITLSLLEQVKILTGCENIKLLNLLIEKTITEIEDLTGEKYYEDDMGLGAELAQEAGLEEGFSKFDNICADMVVFKYNRFGNEGLLNFSVNGNYETYSSTYPPHILRQLQTYAKKVRFY